MSNKIESFTVNFQKRLAGINIFFQFSWAKNGHFLIFHTLKNVWFLIFLCNKKLQNEGIIRNLGIIGGRAIFKVLW